MASIATLRDLVDALIQSAKEENKLREVTENLEIFYEFYSTNEELKSVLSTTVFEFEEKKSIIHDLSQRFGFLDQTKNFISAVIELDKFKTFIGSQDQIINNLKKASGKIIAEVITASTISEYEITRIKESLKNATGREVEVESTVDPSILGGLITKVEDKVYDNSIKTQLNKIRGILTP